MSGPVNVLRIKHVQNRKNPRKSGPVLYVDGRALEDHLADEIMRIHRKPWTEKGDGAPQMNLLRASLEAPGAYDILLCRGCGVSGDLGLEFVVEHDRDLIRWTVRHNWYEPRTPISFVFHRPQYEAAISAVPDPEGG